ncbi:hypothetical protein [[Pseudopropionibacterium] massiliense]|uniref:hypothetical protein n=1 Tax=[Pseudopropionibacterium] massiliense TaxID=2220000 RepID=UPI0010306670|nr:hypothetical protein [[Pseudopropionibacterium] massiliense]
MRHVFLFQILLSLLFQTAGPSPAPPAPTPVDEPSQDVALRVGEAQTINLGEVNLSFPHRYGVTGSFENRLTGKINGPSPMPGYDPAEALPALTGRAPGTTTMTVRNCEPDGITCNDATRAYTITVT